MNDVLPEIVDRLVLALERQALRWAGHDFGPAYRDEIVRPALAAVHGDIASIARRAALDEAFTAVGQECGYGCATWAINRLRDADA